METTGYIGVILGSWKRKWKLLYLRGTVAHSFSKFENCLSPAGVALQGVASLKYVAAGSRTGQGLKRQFGGHYSYPSSRVCFKIPL